MAWSTLTTAPDRSRRSTWSPCRSINACTASGEPGRISWLRSPRATRSATSAATRARNSRGPSAMATPTIAHSSHTATISATHAEVRPSFHASGRPASLSKGNATRTIRNRPSLSEQRALRSTRRMAEPQSRTCARSQKLRRALGSGCADVETIVPIKPNRTGQLEWASCFYLDRPMTNPQGVFKGRKLADAAEAATPGGWNDPDPYSSNCCTETAYHNTTPPGSLAGRRA